jgi:hypothetical protein
MSFTKSMVSMGLGSARLVAEHYEQAGILDRRSGNPDTVAAIRSDEALSERHKAVLLELYETYVREHRAAAKTSPHPTDSSSKESA